MRQICTFFFSSTTMLLLTETTLFHWNLAFELLTPRLNNVKNSFSGPDVDRKVQTWVVRSQGNALSPSDVESSSNQSYAVSRASSNFSASSEREPPVTPLRGSDDGLRYRQPDLEECDSAYRQSLRKVPKHSQRDLSPVRDSL